MGFAEASSHLIDELIFGPVQRSGGPPRALPSFTGFSQLPRRNVFIHQ